MNGGVDRKPLAPALRSQSVLPGHLPRSVQRRAVFIGKFTRSDEFLLDPFQRSKGLLLSLRRPVFNPLHQFLELLRCHSRHYSRFPFFRTTAKLAPATPPAKPGHDDSSQVGG